MSKSFHSDITKLYKDTSSNQQAQSQKESQPLLQKSAPSPSIPQKDNNATTNQAGVQARIPDQASQLSNMASNVSELKLGEYMIHVSFIKEKKI